jgi:hypothetical protein
MAATKIAAEYIGTGTEHLGGIPARDLTDDELDALPDERRAELLANAEGPDPAYKLHGRDLKAEAKEIATAESDPAVAPAPPALNPTGDVTPPTIAPATRPAVTSTSKPPADAKGGE